MDGTPGGGGLSGQMPATLPGLPAPVEKKAPRITARVVEAS
jgi:hypothetical protein